MTAFDDDPEYEAQLKDALGDEVVSWRGNNEEQEEPMGDFVAATDDQSEDGVLDDAPSFRMKVPSENDARNVKDEDDVSVAENRDERLLSEDARSISTGDDSPSVQVHRNTIVLNCRVLNSLFLDPLHRVK
jgi:hypothetical protein